MAFEKELSLSYLASSYSFPAVWGNSSWRTLHPLADTSNGCGPAPASGVINNHLLQGIIRGYGLWRSL
jgi:hypothetical protein